MMARNCPSYKTMYENAQRRIKDLQKEVDELEDELYDGKPKPDPDEDEEVTITAKVREIHDPRLNLEGRSVLVVWL